MSLLIFFIILSIGVSFICSMLEAIILSVTPAYLGSLENINPKLFKRVASLKEDIEQPLASILTFNTIAHTVGAAGAGAEAQRLFGSEILALFSAILTFAILFFSEIIPKSIGANSWKEFLPVAARILPWMIWVSYPIVYLTQKVAKFFEKDNDKVSREEIIAMADIGFNDGAIKESEHKYLTSLIKFDQMKIEEIMTPASKVQTLTEDMRLRDAYEEVLKHNFSRVPVYDSKRKKLKGYILRTKLLQAHIVGQQGTVQNILQPLLVLQSKYTMPYLFRQLIQRREHIVAIVDDKNYNLLGIITLEDLIEHMLDLEIYDEKD